MNTRNTRSGNQRGSERRNGVGPSIERRNAGIQDNQFPVFYFLLFVYLSIEFIRPQSFIPALGVVRPALIVGLVLIAFSLSKFRHEVYMLGTTRLLGGFLGLAALSVLFATNNHWAFQYTQLLALYLLAVVVPAFILVNSVKRFRFLLFFWVFVHAYLAIYCLTHGGKGPGSFLEDENDIALTLNVAIPFAYFLWQSKSTGRFLGWIIAASAVLMVVGVVVSASRGGFVGLAITAIAVIWFSEKRIRNAVLVGLGAAVFFMAIPAEYKKEIQSISDTEDGTRVERFYSWERGWEMFLDNPVLGVGAGNFPWRFSEYELKSDDYDGTSRLHGGRAAHSLYFTLLPEMGLAGTIVFLLLLIQYFRRLIKKTPPAKIEPDSDQLRFFDAMRRALQVSMVGYLVTAVFISVLYYPQMWYLIGFSMIYERLYNSTFYVKEDSEELEEGQEKSRGSSRIGRPAIKSLNHSYE